MIKSTLAALGAALLISACAYNGTGQDGQDGADGVTVASASTKADPSALEGTWRLQSINGAPITAPANRPADAEPASLTFANGSLSAYVYCNRMGGDYVAEPGILKTGTVMSTLMACTGGMEQEAAVGNILRTVESFDITPDGMLILFSSDALTLEATR